MGYDTQLVSVSAPAGFGKTTLLSEWAADSPLNVAWVSLAPSENSLFIFWHYVISAISRAVDSCGSNSLNQIHSSGTIPIETLLIGLINDIADQSAGFAIVLDDYHIISQRSIHASMAFFIDHLPSRVRLIIAGREHPPFFSSRFRLSGRLREIDALNLRFRDDEADTLLNGIYHLRLSEHDVASVKQTTEGWAAGLMLAMLAVRDHEDKHSMVNGLSGGHRLIFDYLMEEVLAGIDEDLCHVMTAASVLERFCPALLQAVSGCSDGHSRIRDMENDNLFLIPLDYQRE